LGFCLYVGENFEFWIFFIFYFSSKDWIKIQAKNKFESELNDQPHVE